MLDMIPVRNPSTLEKVESNALDVGFYYPFALMISESDIRPPLRGPGVGLSRDLFQSVIRLCLLTAERSAGGRESKNGWAKRCSPCGGVGAAIVRGECAIT
jgi:hypothetical protein